MQSDFQTISSPRKAKLLITSQSAFPPSPPRGDLPGGDPGEDPGDAGETESLSWPGSSLESLSLEVSREREV